MRQFYHVFILVCLSLTFSQAQTVEDDFEGNGNITSWFGDNCGLDTNFANPNQEGINTSNTVLRYDDTGGQFANVRFDIIDDFDLSVYNTFTLKIYVPSGGITGSQPNQISLKLQDGTQGSPWLTQSEIIKPLVLDQWQEVNFDFANDPYINLDGSSPPPIQRTDFNRVVLQVNSENNIDHVLAYLDDFLYDSEIIDDPVFDNLVWSDEFNGTGAISSTNWHHQTQLPNGTSWFNGEIQHYTNRVDNSYVENGHLNIVAKKETFNDQGVTKQYTSARLNSKFAFTYGRVEIRAKLPTGLGTWPALWMLGKNVNEDGGYWDEQGFGTTGWPECGEVDIMEHWGNNQNYVQSAMHTPSSFGGTVNLGGQTISTASSEFHLYALEWTSEKMVFSVDGDQHYIYNPPIKNDDTWPFDSDQYLLLNIAILPNIAASFTESAMEIDYIRIYQESTLSNSEVSNMDEVRIFPNPVKDSLTINVPPSLINSTVRVSSVLGQEYYTFTQNEPRINVDLSWLSSGLYIVSIANGDEVFTYKIIKK